MSSLFFFFFPVEKNDASLSSAVDVAAAAKGKQPAIETSRILAAETEGERLKAERCQWPLGRPDYTLDDDGDYEGRLFVKHAVSLFVYVSGDDITVPTDYAHKEGFLASPLRLIAPARDNSN